MEYIFRQRTENDEIYGIVVLTSLIDPPFNFLQVLLQRKQNQK
jgi:hypothetical protein